MTGRNFANHHLASVLMFIAALTIQISPGKEMGAFDETIINDNLGKATRLSAGLHL